MSWSVDEIFINTLDNTPYHIINLYFKLKNENL